MTRVIAIATKEGMVVLADGRALDIKTRKVSKDNEVKLYEMSDLCVGSLAGYATSEHDMHMAACAFFNKDASRRDTSAIAASFSGLYKHAAANSKSKLLHNPKWPMNYMFAGYNRHRDGTFETSIIKVSKPNWDAVPADINPNIGVTGIGWTGTYEYLHARYSNQLTLDSANRLALDAMDEATKAHPDDIGGKLTLWNIKPGEPIQKFKPAKLDKLRKRI